MLEQQVSGNEANARHLCPSVKAQGRGVAAATPYINERLEKPRMYGVANEAMLRTHSKYSHARAP